MKILLFFCAFWSSTYTCTSLYVPRPAIQEIQTTKAPWRPPPPTTSVWKWKTLIIGYGKTIKFTCKSVCDIRSASVKSSSGNTNVNGGVTIPGIYAPFCAGNTTKNPEPCVKTSRSIDSRTVYFHVNAHTNSTDVVLTIVAGNYKNGVEVAWTPGSNTAPLVTSAGSLRWDFGTLKAGESKTVRFDCTSTCNFRSANVKSSTGDPDIYGGETIPGMYRSFCEGHSKSHNGECAMQGKAITNSTVYFHVASFSSDSTNVILTIDVPNFWRLEEVKWTDPDNKG